MAKNLKLWQGESDLMRTKLPIILINKILEPNRREFYIYKQPDKATALLVLKLLGVSRSSLKPERKRGSYSLKHFLLNFISSLTGCSEEATWINRAT